MTDIVAIGFKADYGDLKQADKALDKLSKSGKSVDSTNKKVTSSSKQASSAISSIRSSVLKLAGAYVSIRSLSFAVQEADRYGILQQRIKTATAATGDYGRVSKELYSISQRTGTALE